MKWLFNKYVLSVVSFIIWLLFFDKNDFFTQRDLNKQLKKLYEEKRYYEMAIQKNKSTIEDFKNNIKNVEQYARERYWMKKDNEEVYVVLNVSK